MSNKLNYDEAAITFCGDFAKNFFADFDAQKGQFTPAELFGNVSFDMLKKKNALNNYVLKYYSSLDKNNPYEAKIKKNMDRYLEGLYKIFASNPIELIGSPFLKNNENIDAYCPKQVKSKEKTLDLRNIVKEKYNELNKEQKAAYIRDRNSDNLSKQEKDVLMHWLIKGIGTDDKEMQRYQEEYLKKLISQKSQLSELSVKQIEFVSKYVNNKMLTSRLKELGYKREDIYNYIYIGEERISLGGFQNQNNIYINKNSSLTRDIPSLIQVVCHETEHAVQAHEAKNPNSKIGLDYAIQSVLREYYYSEKKYDVYHNNYRFEQIEQDAEKTGYNFAAFNCLASLGFEKESKDLLDKRNKKSDSRRFEYDFRIDENGKKYTREEFFFRSLNNAITRQPDALKQYPSLLTLYTKEGKPKSFDELISGEFVFGNDQKCKIPEDFCKYYISSGALDTLNLNKFSEETQASIASRLITILGNESSQIGMMRKQKQQYYYKDVAESAKIGVERFHLKTARNIMRFMNKNYQHFMDLQDKGKFSSVMNMDYYDANSKTFKFDNIYEGLVYNKSEHIEEIKQIAIEAEENKYQYREKKKAQTKFNPDTLESSFDTLVSGTILSELQQATQVIETLAQENTLQTYHKLEEK